MKVTFITIKGRFRSAILFSFLFLFSVFSSAQSTTQVITGTANDSLVVYTAVGDLPASEFYTIKVRLVSSTAGWKTCFANITRSLYSDLPTDAKGTNNSREHYYQFVKDWSHTYANIEMNARVEVQIARKDGVPITKAAVHPTQKAEPAVIRNGKAFFFINNPAQITIDIDGIMDDSVGGTGYPGGPKHTVSLFANPIMIKPSLTDPNVMVVEPSDTPPPSEMGSKTIMYFKPGIHKIGRDFKIHPGKNYYIPGDAIVYGTMNNIGISSNNSGLPSGGNIKIYGYGTLSGDLIKHPNYDTDYATVGSEKSWKLIYADNCSNFVIKGISLMNCPMHTANLNAVKTTVIGKKETFCDWVKVITWRGNGDGIGSAHSIENSFFRTQDDCTYVKGDRKKCVFWTDVNGAVFMLAGMPPKTERSILIEDCDVIYPRHNTTTWSGGRIFSKREEQAPREFGITNVDVTFKDIRITDKNQTLETFQLMTDGNSGKSGGYRGIKFINITSARTPEDHENVIIGHVDGPWDDLTFDNVNLGEKRIASVNDFGTITTSYATNLKFFNQKAYLNTNRTIPGLIEGEHFDEGGEGYAYHDDTQRQGTSTFRPLPITVDVIPKTGASNGFVVGFPLSGEWTEYSVNATAGTYDIKLKYFCNTTAAVGDLKVSLNGVTLTTITNIVSQGNNNVATVTVPNVVVTGGNNKIIRLEYVNGAKFDIDSIEFVSSSSTARMASSKSVESTTSITEMRLYPNPASKTLNISFPSAEKNRELKIVNMLGQVVYSQKIEEVNAQIDVQSLHLKGVVFVQVLDKEGQTNHKIIVE